MGSVAFEHVHHSNPSSRNGSILVPPVSAAQTRIASGEGGLVTSLEVVCQALVDSRNLQVHTELGCKLGSPPSWMEVVTLLLASLNRPPSAEGQHPSESEVCDVCACLLT